MYRRLRSLTAAAVGLSVLAAASGCSNGSGPGNGPDDGPDDGPDNGPTTGAIAGVVSSDAGGVAGADVALTGTATADQTTTANGSYLFDDLGAGSYTVTLTPPSGFTLAAGETAGKPAPVTAGQTTTVNWSLVSAGGGGVTVVTASGTNFSPASVTIDVGETVRWVISDGTHTVTPDDGGQPGAWDGTGLLSAGQRFEHTFTTAGVFDYHCIPHQSLGMTGTITVQ